MLVVAAPPSFDQERRYVLQVVLSEWLGLDWTLLVEDRRDVRISLAGDGQQREIRIPEVLFQTSQSEWLRDSSLPKLPLAFAELPEISLRFPPDGRIPIVYGSARDGDPVLSTNGIVTSLGIDVFGIVFFLLTRYEEIAASDADEHGRFRDGASLAVRTGTHREPLADLCTEVLWAALSRWWPRLPRRLRGYRVSLTHDVDFPFACRESRTRILRSIGADLLKRRDPALAARRTSMLLAGCGEEHEADPWNAFGFMMDVSEENGLFASFNFLADPQGRFNGHYSVAEAWIGRLLTSIHTRGHEIGLHGSYQSLDDPRKLRAEYAGLREVAARSHIEQERWGGRQHFLRWANPYSWRAWNDAGLDFDSTVGYAEHVGFRSGTCHPYPVYDLLERRQLHLYERPLISMDAALTFYQHLSPQRSAERIIEVARTCHRYGGEFVGLWHNSELASAAQRRWYRELVPQLVSLG